MSEVFLASSKRNNLNLIKSSSKQTQLATSASASTLKKLKLNWLENKTIRFFAPRITQLPSTKRTIMIINRTFNFLLPPQRRFVRRSTF